MKITKSKLKQIIKEEMAAIAFSEQEGALDKVDSATTSQVRRGALAAATDQGAQGITGAERGLIKKLSSMLVAGAENTNLLSGTIVAKIKQLAKELQKSGMRPDPETGNIGDNV